VTVEVRPVPEADWPAVRALSREAFGGPATPSPGDDERALHTQRHSFSLGGYDATRLVSHARVKPYVQWFGGRGVPMGGIASVAVTASHQRQGVARATVAATLPLLREQGFAVSTLFPATTPLYRALGWEHAGDYGWLDVPGRLLRALGPPTGGVTLRPATADDLPAVHAAYAALARESNGLLDREHNAFVDRRPETMLDVDTFLVAVRDGAVEGWTRADRRTAGHAVEVRAWDVVGTTPEATRALWFALGAGASTAHTVRAKAPREDLLPHLAEPDVTVAEHLPWMLRLVDGAQAVAARGWPMNLTATVDLDIADEQVPDNAGRHRLTVEAGTGTLTRGGDGTVEIDARGLAALYSGYADPRTLRRAGRLRTSDDHSLDTLATMTAGPRPHIRDYF
jgi:predicted acetyltransferase